VRGEVWGLVYLLSQHLRVVSDPRCSLAWAANARELHAGGSVYYKNEPASDTAKGQVTQSIAFHQFPAPARRCETYFPLRSLSIKDDELKKLPSISTRQDASCIRHMPPLGHLCNVRDAPFASFSGEDPNTADLAQSRHRIAGGKYPLLPPRPHTELPAFKASSLSERPWGQELEGGSGTPSMMK